MAVSSSNLCIVIIIVLVAIALIYFLNVNNQQPTVTSPVGSVPVTTTLQRESFGNVSTPARSNLALKSSMSDDIFENIINDHTDEDEDQYDDEDEDIELDVSEDAHVSRSRGKKEAPQFSPNDPMAALHGSFKDKDCTLRGKKSDKDFVFKRKKFTRRTPKDFEDQFNLDNFMPKERRKGWFGDEPLIDTKRVGDRFMLHPKTGIGLNTGMGSRKNQSLDLRGDIQTRKHDLIWGNSTIEPNKHAKGLCG